MEYITEHPEVKAERADNWKFIPQEIAEPAAERDRMLLFGE